MDAAAPRRQAFQLLHQALNRQAGQVLFAGSLPAFVQQQPAFAPLQGALAEFFARSEAEFFAPAAAVQGPAQDDTLAWLRDLARQLRAAERSA
jgi:mxaA protein